MVADIMWVNNLISDKDIFALRAIKMPVKIFRSLTETLSYKGKQTSCPASVKQDILSPNDSFSSSESAGNFFLRSRLRNRKKS